MSTDQWGVPPSPLSGQVEATVMVPVVPRGNSRPRIHSTAAGRAIRSRKSGQGRASQGRARQTAGPDRLLRVVPGRPYCPVVQPSCPSHRSSDANGTQCTECRAWMEGVGQNRRIGGREKPLYEQTDGWTDGRQRVQVRTGAVQSVYAMPCNAMQCHAMHRRRGDGGGWCNGGWWCGGGRDVITCMELCGMGIAYVTAIDNQAVPAPALHATFQPGNGSSSTTNQSTSHKTAQPLVPI